MATVVPPTLLPGSEIDTLFFKRGFQRQVAEATGAMVVGAVAVVGAVVVVGAVASMSAESSGCGSPDELCERDDRRSRLLEPDGDPSSAPPPFEAFENDEKALLWLRVCACI